MTAQQVLDTLGRMPDQRKDEKEEILVYWKLEDESVLQVNFRQENFVSHIGLQFRPPRPTNDFWLLPPVASSQNEMRQSVYLPESRSGTATTPAYEKVPQLTSGEDAGTGISTARALEGKAPSFGGEAPHTGLEARDPRWRADYKASQTTDRERTVWVRDEDDERGFRVEVSFLSTERKRAGEGYQGHVEFKYVSVSKRDLKKFDQAMKPPR